MKILAHPIDVIFETSRDGVIKPLKIRYFNPEKQTENTFTIDELLDTRETMMAGEKARIFTCECLIGEKKVLFELRYTLSNSHWVLYRIVGR